MNLTNSLAVALTYQMATPEVLRRVREDLTDRRCLQALLIDEWLDHGFGAGSLVSLTDLLLYEAVSVGGTPIQGSTFDHYLSDRGNRQALEKSLSRSTEHSFVLATSTLALRASPFGFVDNFAQVLDAPLASQNLIPFVECFREISASNFNPRRMSRAKSILVSQVLETYSDLP